VSTAEPKMSPHERTQKRNASMKTTILDVADENDGTSTKLI
jgi:hypothetical protein